MIDHLPGSSARMTHVLLVHKSHLMQILLALRNRFVVDIATVKCQQSTLLSYTQMAISPVDPADSLNHRARPLFFNPLQLHIEDANLLVKHSDQWHVRLLVMARFEKQLRSVVQLLLPEIDLSGMVFVLLGDL
jgi:hypothetical protein